MVEALDAWNIQSYGNNVDAVQDVQRFSGTYSGGRIQCRYMYMYKIWIPYTINIHNYYPPSVAKRIAPSASGSNQDLDLNDNYYVLYGRRRAASGAGALFPHEQGPTNNPSISSSIVNPTGGLGPTDNPDTTDMISGLIAPVRS